jgi:hypothetical protein
MRPVTITDNLLAFIIMFLAILSIKVGDVVRAVKNK